MYSFFLEVTAETLISKIASDGLLLLAQAQLYVYYIHLIPRVFYVYTQNTLIKLGVYV